MSDTPYQLVHDFQLAADGPDNRFIRQKVWIPHAKASPFLDAGAVKSCEFDIRSYSGRNNRAAGSPLGKDYYPTTDCNGVFFLQPSVPVTPLNSISEYMLLPFVYNTRQVPPVHYFCAAFQLYDFFFLSESLLEMNHAGEQ